VNALTRQDCMTMTFRSEYPGVLFGRYVVIGEDVTIGAGTVLGNNVVVHDGSSIGCDVRIDDGVVIGKEPLRSRLSAMASHVDLEPASIGDEVLIGTHAVIYRGATVGNSVLIADLATVREQVTIGEMSIIGRGVAVENMVTIGRKCKIETGAYITAMSSIGDFCFVAPEVTFTNDNYVGRTEERFKHFKGVTMQIGSRIGANATVLPGIVIGEDALVAAGSIVTKDVPSRAIVMGSPARVIRQVPADQLLSATTPRSGGSQ
jgi:UDP-2-acetamido-3-amino-2,3-dideoxy-glucuronate N-acetyltransferase